MNLNSPTTIKQIKSDPVLFAKHILGIDLWAKQREILASVKQNRSTTVKSCHAIGKSTTAAAIAIWFLYAHENSRVLITAPTQRQVESVLMAEIHKRIREAPVELPGEKLKTKIVINPDWFIMGFTASENDDSKFQGHHADDILGIIDEACGVGPSIVAGMDSCLTSGANSKLLYLGNPVSTGNAFHKSFSIPQFSQFTVSAFDTPNFTKFGITIDDIRNRTWKQKVGKGKIPRPYLINPQAVQDIYDKYGEESSWWDSRVMAEFPNAADEVLIPTDWVDRAFEAWKDAERTGWTGTARLGLDVARLGPDSTVLSIARDQGIEKLLVAPKSDATKTRDWALQQVRALEQKGYNIEVLNVDADGYGAGIYDMLFQARPDIVKEMRGGFKADEVELPNDRTTARYFNKRAQWFWELRQMLDPNNEQAPVALPPNEELKDELSNILWEEDQRGIIKLEPKKKMKERGLNSPDHADAVVYALAEGEQEDDAIARIAALAKF